MHRNQKHMLWCAPRTTQPLNVSLWMHCWLGYCTVPQLLWHDWKAVKKLFTPRLCRISIRILSIDYHWFSTAENQQLTNCQENLAFDIVMRFTRTSAAKRRQYYPWRSAGDQLGLMGRWTEKMPPKSSKIKYCSPGQINLGMKRLGIPKFCGPQNLGCWMWRESHQCYVLIQHLHINSLWVHLWNFTPINTTKCYHMFSRKIAFLPSFCQAHPTLYESNVHPHPIQNKLSPPQLCFCKKINLVRFFHQFLWNSLARFVINPLGSSSNSKPTKAPFVGGQARQAQGFSGTIRSLKRFTWHGYIMGKRTKTASSLR